MTKTLKIKKAIAKIGWVSFAGYLVSTICGAEKVAAVTGFTTTACAIACNGITAAAEISDIINS